MAGLSSSPTARPPTACPTTAPARTSTPPTPTPRSGTGASSSENYVDKGFDAFWADETEPDLPPNGSYFHVGPGTRVLQRLSALPHRGVLQRHARGHDRARAHPRARRLSRRAAQRRDLLVVRHQRPTGTRCKRQVPTGINFVASGMPYWSTDIGGWQYLPA